MACTHAFFVVAILAGVAVSTVTSSACDGPACSSDSSSLLQSRVATKLAVDADVEDLLKKAPPLCHAAIVAETCLDFNSDSTSDMDNEVSTTVSAIAGELSTESSFIVQVMKELAMTQGKGKCDDWCDKDYCVGDWSEDCGGCSFCEAGEVPKAVNCAALCASVKDYIKTNSVLPPASDTACYKKNGKIVCDLDVRPEALAKVQIKGDMPETTDEAIMENTKLGLLADTMVESLSPRFERYYSDDQDSNDSNDTHAPPEDIAYSTGEAIGRIANFFRIYPEPEMSSSEGATFTELSAAGDSQSSTACTSDIPRIHAKTKAFVVSVIRQINLRATRTSMSTWFGRTDDTTRARVLQIGNAVEHMLSNVHYAYPGPVCKSNVYGYVYARGANTCTDPMVEKCTKNSEGKYVIYLCTEPGNGVYCTVPESQKIETIVHEGAHHGSAYLDDVQPTPYERGPCKNMAINFPDKAIRNADSFCYYIYDVAKAAQATTAEAPCIDKDSQCPGYSQGGGCTGEYASWMATNCPKSCSKCVPCIDKDSQCPGFSQGGGCTGEYASWMATNCPKSCSKCS